MAHEDGLKVSDHASQQATWKQESVAFRRALGIQPNYKPWTSRYGFRGLGLPNSDRMRDVLDCYVASELKKQSRMGHDSDECAVVDVMACVDGKFIDVSQSVKRQAHSNEQGCCRSFLTGTLLYDFSRDAVLTGSEMLQAHGFPGPGEFIIPADVSDAQARALAGEGMSIPSLSAILWCLFLTRQFPG